MTQLLRCIELKSGYSDNGPAWIGYITSSRTGRTLYFNGRGLLKLKGQQRGPIRGITATFINVRLNFLYVRHYVNF
jgi:hypothetical protein